MSLALILKEVGSIVLTGVTGIVGTVSSSIGSISIYSGNSIRSSGIIGNDIISIGYRCCCYYYYFFFFFFCLHGRGKEKEMTTTIIQKVSIVSSRKQWKDHPSCCSSMILAWCWFLIFAFLLCWVLGYVIQFSSIQFQFQFQFDSSPIKVGKNTMPRRTPE